MEVVEVEVDHRERGAALVRALEGRPDVRLRFRTLRAGDYAIGRAVGIERKSAEDLARSIIEGRLFRQAAGLARLYDRPIVLIEGYVPGRPISHVSPEAIRGALVSLAAVFRIPALPVRDPEEGAAVILGAARQVARSFRDGYVRGGYRPRGLRARRLFVLQGLPGVGPRRAAALLDLFGDPASVMTAAAEALRKTPGIGPAVAAGIARVVRQG